MLDHKGRPYRVAIIGGGASGVCLAGLLANRKGQDLPLDVEIFEQGEDILRKLLATGNGRCNFTNRDISPNHYTGKSREDISQILEEFGFEEAVAFFQSLGMPSKVLDSGMAYPVTMKAETPVSLLKAWIKYGGVGVHLSCEIRSIEKEDGNYRVRDRKGRDWGPYQTVVLATGGAYGIGKKEWSRGYSLVKGLGHRLTPIYPAICGLAVQESTLCKKASGDKLEADLRMINEGGEVKARSGDLLFTDYGISGMGVFRLSNDLMAMAAGGKMPEVTVDLLPHLAPEEGKNALITIFNQRKEWRVEEALAGFLPRKILRAGLEEIGIRPEDRFSSYLFSHYENWLSFCKSLTFHIKGSRKKDHGQVTCGGLAMDQVDSLRLESRLSKGLYFMGEVLDVQGECGGYNLHWAWASAHTVFQAIVKEAEDKI